MNYKNKQKMGEAIAMNFEPKNIVNLDCTKSNGCNLMLVGNKSSNEFAVINITNNLIKVNFSNGMPKSLKKVFFKNQESSQKQFAIKFIEVLEQDEKQKLVIMCCYNSSNDQFSFYTMNLLQKAGPFWDFELTDVYRMKPGKMVHSFLVSQYQEDKKNAKIIVAYDCSKLVEILVNMNIKETNF
jgi:hypothetical protein